MEQYQGSVQAEIRPIKDLSKRRYAPNGRNIIHGDKIKGNYWGDYRQRLSILGTVKYYVPQGEVYSETNGFTKGADFLPLEYSRTSAIHISSSDDFTFENGVLYGTGSRYDPYVIEACDFNFTKYPNLVENSIWIENTDDYFEIKNCKIDTAFTGIYLKNAKNGKIFDVEFKKFSGEYMIRINSSSNIGIYSSNFGRAKYISLTKTAIECRNSRTISIANNSVSGVPVGISLTESSNVVISDNRMSLIPNEYDRKAYFRGISIDSSNNAVLRNNTISDAAYGIGIESSSDISIEGGLLEDNYYVYLTGIYPVISHTDGGAVLLSNVSNAKISGLMAENNFNAIMIRKSSHISVQNSTILQNKNDGAVLEEATNISLFDNVISSNPSGLKLWRSTNSTIRSNYILDNEYGLSLVESTGNLIYNNYLDNKNNVQGNTANNSLNISKIPGRNIIGGEYLGGNYWGDYNGVDMNGDKLGDTPWNGDMLPLMNTSNIHITSNDEFDSTHGVSSGSGTIDDPYVIENKVIDATATHGIWIENTTAYFVIRNVTIDEKLGRTYGVYLTNVKNGRIEDVSINNTKYGVYLLNSSSIQLAVDVSRSAHGILLNNSTSVLINGSRIHDNEIGLVAAGSENVDVYGCSINSNSIAIRFNSTSNIRIENCTMKNNHYVTQRMEKVFVFLGYSNQRISRWMGGGIWINSSHGIIIKGNNITAHFSGRYHSDAGISITGSDVDMENNSIEGYEFGIKVANSNANIRNNTISRDAFGISLKNSNATIAGNTMRGFQRLLESESVGVYADNSTCRIWQNRIEGFKGYYFDVFGRSLEIGWGIHLRFSSAAISQNIVLSNGGYGVLANSSEVDVITNTISDNLAGIQFINSDGTIINNYVVKGDYGVKVSNANAVKIEENTLAENLRAGINLSSSPGMNCSISKNRIYGSEKGIFLKNATASISENSIYKNVYDIYADSLPSLDHIYTGTDNVTTNLKLNLTPMQWDAPNFGSKILRASILSVESTQFGESRDVGDFLSVYVHADSAFEFEKERLYLLDSRYSEDPVNFSREIELYSNSISGNVVDKAIGISILDVNDSTYDLFYEVTDSADHKAYTFVRVKVKNLDLKITNVTTTFAKRIYALYKVGKRHQSINDTFPKYERGAFVNVTVKNNGVKGGFARLEVILPDFLHNVTQNPVAYIFINASEERTYSFYVLLTKYDWVKGWEPMPSEFPSTKVIPVAVNLHNYPSYTLADSVQSEIHFKFGPIFKIMPGSIYNNIPYISIAEKASDSNKPYDGDGDSLLEAAESHHFNLYFINVGDEPANIETFQYKEIIPCNASKYVTNSSRNYITHASPVYENYYRWWEHLQNSDYYAPKNSVPGSTVVFTYSSLFGALYPSQTGGDSYDVKKEIVNGWIDWWPDDPDAGIYPPADYTGKVITLIMLKYSRSDVPYRYYTPSINTIPINVRALDKTFIPSTYETSDIKLQVHAVDPEKGTVHLTMKNLNDYVYFQYKADGLYGNQEGYRWYHVLPPEDTFNVIAQNAREQNKTIPHLKVVVGAKWSLWANELKLGMMGLEAVVNIVLDEVTGGVLEIEFADTIMGATSTLLQIMNAAETVNNGGQPMRIDGVLFDQAEIDSMAIHGLDQAYFSRIKSGDIDSKMITTFINAIANDEKLRKVFQREVLKAVFRNLGLDDILEKLEGSGVSEDDFDRFQDALLKYLVENKKLTKEQAEKIEKTTGAAKVFVDLGEWAYNNLNAVGMPEVTINILDPPSNYSVSIEESEVNYFGGYYSTQADVGNGNVTIEFLNNSLVRIRGVYTMSPENASVPLDKIREMNLSLKGHRNERNEMEGDAYIEIIPQPSEMLSVVSAFRNPNVPRSMLSSQFVKLENVTAVTEGDRIILHARGILRCQDKDVAINGSTRINESIVTVRIEKTGYYAVERNGSLALNMTFGPVIGISLNSTGLSVINATNLQSDLPFRRVGDVYHLKYLPDKIMLKVEAKTVEFEIDNAYVYGTAIGALLLAIVSIVLRKRM